MTEDRKLLPAQEAIAQAIANRDPIKVMMLSLGRRAGKTVIEERVKELLDAKKVESEGSVIDLDAAIMNAQAAFWDALEPLGSHLESGDMSPGSFADFEIACRDAVRALVEFNAGDENIMSRCNRCHKPMRWLPSPTGGWWKHEDHPNDGHTARWATMDVS